ncbi:uncharacterized protein ColSpa_05382 [Colletotrichum spaethianum]|uniref:Uncharacterized protein n=1 Tax=Colletotrichum spaethianum TaxID=700344 RepID=A0AA37P612_9PEZI|nr:uncharacterized protein ColSpa_05382 [Colletotrichum spaethianum]GKT45201.1 hypothetical protein ColSpa_05382 [Colletotrichum spaethianum]
MGSVEQMAGYRDYLLAETPPASLGKPVTEICLFKLLPTYARDHTAAEAEFCSQIVANTTPGKPYAKGIRALTWGFSEADPATFFWTLDWDKIENHWDFWLTPSFSPVIAAINKLFEPGRPLVRHFDFDGAKTPSRTLSVARFMIWDDGTEGVTEGRARALGNSKGMAREVLEGYAVDVNEQTWWCSLLLYESLEEAADDHVKSGDGAESHIVRLRRQDA